MDRWLLREHEYKTELGVETRLIQEEAIVLVCHSSFDHGEPYHLVIAHCHFHCFLFPCLLQHFVLLFEFGPSQFVDRFRDFLWQRILWVNHGLIEDIYTV